MITNSLYYRVTDIVARWAIHTASCQASWTNETFMTKEKGQENLSTSPDSQPGLPWRTVLVDTLPPTSIHTRILSPIAIPTLTSPRPPSLPLEAPWGAILTLVEPPCQRSRTRQASRDFFPRVECWDCRCLDWDRGVEVQAILPSMREMRTFYWLRPREGHSRRQHHDVHKFPMLESWCMLSDLCIMMDFSGLGIVIFNYAC